MFTFENDEEAICKSLVDLAKLSRENAIATLKVIKVLQNRISFLNGKAKVVLNEIRIVFEESILLDCFDVSLSISMVDEAIWFFLEFVRNILDWTEELASRLELLPTGRRSLPLLILLEKDLIPPYILTQAAFLCPRAVLTKERSSKKTIDTMIFELVCYFKQENWTEVLHSLEKFSSINENLLNSAVKRLSLDPVILIQMHLRVIWELKVEIVWNLVRQLNETSLRSFFDMTILSSELSFHPLSDKIVRLHSTILRGELEQVKTADKVDRIISGVMTGNVDMVAIWYTEVIEEFLSEPCDVQFNPFPFSTIEFKLMVVSVIVAILQDSPEEQLHTLEMSKWHIDNRQMLNHGCGSPNKPQINLEEIRSLIYTYRVGRVSVSWALNEDKILISYKTLTEYLSFYEECIVRILRLRGYSRKDERMLKVENGGMLISNTHMEIKTQYRHLWMRESATQMRQYSIGLLVLYQSLNPKEEFVRSCSIRLYLMMRKIAQSKIFLVNVTESFLSKEIILAANAGPQIIISVGRLDFDVIRAFFLCGTQALVEVPIDVSLDDVDCLLSLLLSGELISMACPVNYIIYGNSSLRITSISSLANLRETIREDPTSFYAFARMVREKRNKCDVINRIAAIISDMDADEWAKISCILSLRDTQEINSIWNAVQDDRLDELKGFTEALKEPNALPFFRSIYDGRKSKKKWKGQRTRSKSGYASDGGELVRQCISRTRSIRNIPKYMCSSAMVLSVEQPPHNITAK
uniref:Rod_C domain-containing protein n=1 Tax=Heterorhabditis bacteriophora TaxID=37862 RepID=A0A1I7XAZ8_HETBA